MAGHFVIDVGRLNLAPFLSAGAVRSRPSISPPQNWVCPKGNARRSLSTGQVGVLLVCNKANFDLVVRAAGPRRLPVGHKAKVIAAH